MTETQATSGAAGTSMDRGERDEAAGSSAADRSAVGRATVPADKGGSEQANDVGRGDRPAVTASARVGNSAPGRAGMTSVLQAPPASAAPPSGGPNVTRPTGAGNRSQRPAGLATVGSTPTGAGRVAEAVRSARGTVSSAAGRGPRRARLFVKRVDPWSVMKFSFAVSFVMFFVLIVATAVLYLALDQMDVFSHVNSALATITSNNKSIKVTAGIVIGGAGGLGLVGVVLFTALATLGAFVYNVCADLVGGVEVTLSEKE